MLNNATGFQKIYIAVGYTDLRRGIDGLASIVKFNFQLDPYEMEITLEQYQALMQGLEIVSRHPIQEVQPQDLL